MISAEKVRCRKFVVLPAGSGKTFLCNRCSARFVDGDNLFIFPEVKNWIKNFELKNMTDKKNIDILARWLNGPKDGKILLYADDLGMIADAYFLLPEDVNKHLLESRIERTVDASHWERILAYRNRLIDNQINIKLFTLNKSWSSQDVRYRYLTMEDITNVVDSFDFDQSLFLKCFSFSRWLKKQEEMELKYYKETEGFEILYNEDTHKRETLIWKGKVSNIMIQQLDMLQTLKLKPLTVAESIKLNFPLVPVKGEAISGLFKPLKKRKRNDDKDEE